MESRAVTAVLGGGIIGMSIAWRLAQAGAAVTVFDAGRIGNQASWAAAGMLAPGGEFEERSAWSELALESLSLYPEFVRELESESGVSVDYRKCGAFDAAFSEKEGETLRSRATRQNAIGIYSEQFPPARVPGLRDGAIAAQYYPFDSVVNPRHLVRALRLACARAGVRFREWEPIEQIPTADSRTFDRTVIAAGAWSTQIQMPSALQNHAMPKAFPVRGHLVAFEESSGLCDAIVRHGHTYLLRRAPNFVLAGSSTENAGFDRTIDGAIAAEIAHRAGELIPQLIGRSYTAWNGLRPGSESGRPVTGRLGDSSVWLAYGHYRNGILLAPATARVIADEMLLGSVRPASSQTDWSSPIAHPQ